ncbi:MAG: Lipid II:glycine glycyltransferase [Chloroflexi bacterium]|nr:Lipid II:glycine glycyltransferase [Chloroflexota bacterium]
MSVVDKTAWIEFLKKHPNAHILQDAAWGDLKSEFGWEVEHVIEGDVGAQVLFKSLPLGYTVAYIPRGPVAPQGWVSGQWGQFLEEVDGICQQKGAIFLKVEPDLWTGESAPAPAPPPGFRTSLQSIQPPRTITVDLTTDEDDILMRMKSKTRYNIRLAGRKEIEVTQSSRVEEFYELLSGTSDRADFGIHTLAYYQRILDLFEADGKCKIFTAKYKGQPLASVLVFARGQRAWYFYGASSREHRDRMPTYRVQWEAMRWAKERGCHSYDLWGVPDEDFETLEDHFLERHDGLWSVYRFKRGFGGELKRTRGPWDRVYKPMFYTLYRFWAGRGE